MEPGEAVIIFTPDSKYTDYFFSNSASLFFCASIATHYPIAIYAIQRGLHVLITKPATQLLSHHNALIEAARKHNVLCFVEHHKRSVVVLNVKFHTY
jgi:D-galacturonate reductase